MTPSLERPGVVFVAGWSNKIEGITVGEGLSRLRGFESCWGTKLAGWMRSRTSLLATSVLSLSLVSFSLPGHDLFSDPWDFAWPAEKCSGTQCVLQRETLVGTRSWWWTSRRAVT